MGEIKYTIDESAAEHAHLLDSPYGDGTYRQELGLGLGLVLGLG